MIPGASSGALQYAGDRCDSRSELRGIQPKERIDENATNSSDASDISAVARPKRPRFLQPG